MFSWLIVEFPHHVCFAKQTFRKLKEAFSIQIKFSLSENTFTSQFWFKTAYPIKNYTEANILLPLIFPFSYLNFAFQGFVLAIIQIPKE